SRRRAADGRWSWYYGQEATGNYDTGGPNSGSLTSPVIDLRGATAATLSYDEWRQTDCFFDSDLSLIQISVDGGPFQLLRQSWTNTEGWATRVLDLAAFGGAQVQVRLFFTTNDEGFPPPLFNDIEGWYLDNVRVIASDSSGADAADGMIQVDRSGAVVH